MGRLLDRIASRTVSVNTMVLWLHGPLTEPPPIPAGFKPIRLRASDPQAEAIARAAMQAADDDGDAEVPQRFASGAEMFGWMAADGTVPSFIWIGYRNRVIGTEPLRDQPGRAFFFDAQTLKSFRGRGLFPALLEYVISTLSKEHVDEFISDVNRLNTASRRGMEETGFRPIASITALRFFHRWNVVTRRKVHDVSASPIFIH